VCTKYVLSVVCCVAFSVECEESCGNEISECFDNSTADGRECAAMASWILNQTNHDLCLENRDVFYSNCWVTSGRSTNDTTFSLWIALLGCLYMCGEPEGNGIWLNYICSELGQTPFRELSSRLLKVAPTVFQHTPTPEHHSLVRFKREFPSTIAKTVRMRSTFEKNYQSFGRVLTGFKTFRFGFNQHMFLRKHDRQPANSIALLDDIAQTAPLHFLPNALLAVFAFRFGRRLSISDCSLRRDLLCKSERILSMFVKKLAQPFVFFRMLVASRPGLG